MADYTTIQNGAAITSGQPIEASHLVDNFNAIISAFADRLDKTDTDPQNIAGKVTLAGGVDGQTSFDDGLLVSLLSFFAQGIKLGALQSTGDGDIGYNSANNAFEGYTGGSKKTIVTPRLGMASPLKPIWQSSSVVRVPAGYWQATTTGTIIDVASNLDVNLASTGALGREAGTPTEQADTWYYLWLCRGASGVTAVWSNSRTSITAPAGYTDTTALISAAFRNDNSSNILPIKYVGGGKCKYETDHYLYNSGVTPQTQVLSAVNSSSFVSQGLGAFVPPLSETAHLGLYVGSAAATFMTRPTGSTAFATRSISNLIDGVSELQDVTTNATQSIDYKNDGGAWSVMVTGYTIT